MPEDRYSRNTERMRAMRFHVARLRDALEGIYDANEATAAIWHTIAAIASAIEEVSAELEARNGQD